MTLHGADIKAFWEAELAARRKYWIAGVPTRRDLVAVEKHVAHRLKTTVEAVRAAVAAVQPVPVPHEPEGYDQWPN